MTSSAVTSSTSNATAVATSGGVTVKQERRGSDAAKPIVVAPAQNELAQREDVRENDRLNSLNCECFHFFMNKKNMIDFSFLDFSDMYFGYFVY